MQNLPSELFDTVTNFLTIQEVARLRQVCQSYRSKIDETFGRIPRLHIQYSIENEDATISHLVDSSYPRTERSVVLFAQGSMRNISLAQEQLHSFFHFVSRYFKSLEVIDAPMFTIDFYLLKLISVRLKYFSFYDIRFENSFDFEESCHVPSLFPALEAFDIFSVQKCHGKLIKPHIPFDHNQFHKFRDENNLKPFKQCIIYQSTETTCQLPSHIASLKVFGSFFKLTDEQEHLLPSLQSLTALVNPSIYSCQLPNLKSAVIESPDADARLIVNLLQLSMDILQHLTLRLKPCSHLIDLIQFMPKCERLTYLQLDIDLVSDEVHPKEQIVLSLPPNLIELDLAILGANSFDLGIHRQLRILTLRYMPDRAFSFEFCKLKYFIFNQITAKNYGKLVESLRHSKHLQYLAIDTSYNREVKVTSGFVKKLVGLLQHLLFLELLEVDFKVAKKSGSSYKKFTLKKCQLPNLNVSKVKWKVSGCSLKVVD